jgi:hypothetical protein
MDSKKHNIKSISVIIIICLLLLISAKTNAGSSHDKVAVLLTAWGQPARYVFEYSWYNHLWCRDGDKTLYPGQPCKIGHVGKFPQESHLGIMPWGLNNPYPGAMSVYDGYGIYKLEDDVFMSINPYHPSLTPAMIPAGTSIVPVSEMMDPVSGRPYFPFDKRTGTESLPGWYKIVMPNGLCDMYELNNMTFIRWYSMEGRAIEPWLASECDDVEILEEAKYTMTKQLLEEHFGNAIDVRFGYYTGIPGYSKHEMDIAEEFANEGFRKMLVARETTDNNHYANNFMTGNYIKERLCELGVLEETELYQTRQIGRTPEFNKMNIENVRPLIEAYPEGSNIAFVYVTIGLPWGSRETYGSFGTQHPWWKEVYHENAFLNYLSWKKALQREFGNRYKLVFSLGEADSNLMRDSFFTYAYYGKERLGGHFYTTREGIQMAKQAGADKIIIAPCHWFEDNYQITIATREINNLPIASKKDLQAENYTMTFCEDDVDNPVACDSNEAAAEITYANSYTHKDTEFATVYYAVLRGTLERFGLYPKDEWVLPVVSTVITKLNGGTVEVLNAMSRVNGAKIEIPADPYPDRPDSFAYDTAIPINDPKDSFNCLWEDTEIIIGHRLNPPPMKNARPSGPAVHCGPYRTIFNRDVTVTIPYDSIRAGSREVKVYIYNLLSETWDEVDGVSAQNGRAVFKTQVLGLFRAGVER